MANITGATNTQKTIMLSLAEGWHLRRVDQHGWCLFQPMRQRPFARVSTSTVESMTDSGWLSEGTARREISFRPEKMLTNDGRRYAKKLIAKQWAENYDWDPYRKADCPDLNATQCQGMLAA
jgi:hypothetical protein